MMLSGLYQHKDKEEQVKCSSSSSPLDSSGNEDNDKEFKEPDYDEKEGEEKQELETVEMTINQVFWVCDYLSCY
jgi:hypothetical protein